MWPEVCQYRRRSLIIIHFLHSLRYLLVGRIRKPIYAMPSFSKWLSATTALAVGVNSQYTNTTSNTTKVSHNEFAALTYSLVDTYNAANWYSTQTFYTGSDPTHGFVQYLSQSAAQSLGILSTAGNQIYMGVDWTTANTVNGRSSVRTSSNKAYTHGLFIADIAHMPDSICGVWPAFWTFGPNWPASGEIDIIEGVNLNSLDTITLHTSAGCTANIAGSLGSTALLQSNCNANNGNDGCGVSTATNYGTNFNTAGGGVYAMQVSSSRNISSLVEAHGSVSRDLVSRFQDISMLKDLGSPIPLMHILPSPHSS